MFRYTNGHICSFIQAGEVIAMWKEGDGFQDNTFVKRKVSNAPRELIADERMAGRRHFWFKLSTICITGLWIQLLLRSINCAKLQDKTGVAQLIINQPDGSGPEGPLPHLEGAAGRDRTHVTPD
jgi:hypothetical protein